jgi:hypothetical protein
MTVPALAMPRVLADEMAQHRWDGEGGNVGMPATRRRHIRANALARVRRAGRTLKLI